MRTIYFRLVLIAFITFSCTKSINRKELYGKWCLQSIGKDDVKTKASWRGRFPLLVIEKDKEFSITQHSSQYVGGWFLNDSILTFDYKRSNSRVLEEGKILLLTADSLVLLFIDNTTHYYISDCE